MFLEHLLDTVVPQGASHVAQLVKNACNAGDLGSMMGWEDPLERGKATHSSIVGILHPTIQSMGLQRVGHN